MSLKLAWSAGLIVVLGFLPLISPAFAQAHHHPPEHAQLHENFYRDWMRPDQPTVSCCNLKDCYPTEARFTNGKWFARRREDGNWLFVPPTKIELNRDSPDGRNHMCAHPPGASDVPLCFIPGGGT
jgi:hypothetical protein